MTRGDLARPRAVLDDVLAPLPGRLVPRRLGSVDADGYWYLHGRSDDTLNIAGKRIGPAELESAAVSHPDVAEAAAIGVPHEVKGEVVWLFCVAAPGREPEPAEVRRGRRGGAREGVRARNGSCSWPRCRRRAPRRSCGARCGRRRSGTIPATCRRSRTRNRWTRSRRLSMADALSGVALVTGGGRGIGANIARELAGAGMDVVVTGRTREQVEAVADEIGGRRGRRRRRAAGGRRALVRARLGELDLLVNNAGIAGAQRLAWDEDPETWWHVFEVNVLGAFLCCRAALPGMVERGSGRIVNVSSGASYLPIEAGAPRPPTGRARRRSAASPRRSTRRLGSTASAHSTSHRGWCRRTMTAPVFGDDAPWTPPELAPRLVRVLASGRADELGGRYIHAEHDDIEELIPRADEVRRGSELDPAAAQRLDGLICSSGRRSRRGASRSAAKGVERGSRALSASTALRDASSRVRVLFARWRSRRSVFRSRRRPIVRRVRRAGARARRCRASRVTSRSAAPRALQSLVELGRPAGEHYAGVRRSSSSGSYAARSRARGCRRRSPRRSVRSTSRKPKTHSLLAAQ